VSGRARALVLTGAVVPVAEIGVSGKVGAQCSVTVIVTTSRASIRAWEATVRYVSDSE
jgi:hypothetical protein